MKNKAQVTLFIIMGLILLVVAGLVFYVALVNNDDKVVFKGEVDARGIEFMIDNCISKVGREGLDLLGKNGNYIDVPGVLEVNGTSYWIYQYANVMPILNSSIDEFQIWFNNNFENCVDYSSFVGYNVETGSANSTIDYSAEEVIIKLNYPLKVTQQDKQKTIDSFENVLNVRYRRVYERAREMVNAHFIPSFDYRQPFQLVDSRDFKINYTLNDENNLLFTVIDDVELEQNNKYIFNFATNLNRSYLKRTVDVSPEALDFFMTFVVYSPDRMAQLFLQRGVNVDSNFLEVWQEYDKNSTREVISHVEYTIKGGLKPGPKIKENITWYLNYPIYQFGPDGTKFTDSTGNVFPQRLAIYWDDDKIPNLGPMGILYRGPLSDYEWRPLITDVDYNNSFVFADITGFSEYSPIDCNRQPCKEVSVKSKSKPKKSLLCAISAIMDTLLPILIIIVIILIIATIGFGGALYTVLVNMADVALLGTLSGTVVAAAGGFVGVAATAAAYIGGIAIIMGVASVGLTAFGAQDYDGGDTYVNFIPTCDQIVEVVCKGGSKLDSGYGELNGEQIPSDSTKEFTVYAGETQQLVAVAEECETGNFKCYSCDLTCTAYYK